MPNPGGNNQFDHFEREAIYGDVKKSQQLTREAPMSGAPISALNTPRRLQKQQVKQGKAVRQNPQPDAQPETPMPPVTTTPPYPQYLAQTMGEIAAVPGASPLVQFLAQKAQEQAAKSV